MRSWLKILLLIGLPVNYISPFLWKKFLKILFSPGRMYVLGFPVFNVIHFILIQFPGVIINVMWWWYWHETRFSEPFALIAHKSLLLFFCALNLQRSRGWQRQDIGIRFIWEILGRFNSFMADFKYVVWIPRVFNGMQFSNNHFDGSFTNSFGFTYMDKTAKCVHVKVEQRNFRSLLWYLYHVKLLYLSITFPFYSLQCYMCSRGWGMQSNMIWDYTGNVNREYCATYSVAWCDVMWMRVVGLGVALRLRVDCSNIFARQYFALLWWRKIQLLHFF